jgi:hypothetical protein
MALQPAVERTVDARHPTAPDLFLDAVVTELLADEGGHQSGVFAALMI